MTKENSIDYWINLSLVPGLGVASLWRLLRHFQSPKKVLAATETELKQVSGLRENQRKALLSCTKNHWNPAPQKMEKLARFGAMAICFSDSCYPTLLKQLPDPPLVLYVKGDVSFLQREAVAVVGSRAASSYGMRIAYEIGRDLSQAGLVVVSGLAAGIDSQAHRGVFEIMAGGSSQENKKTGKTIAVLGCGLDSIYPRQNESLYHKIAERGLLVSEYPLGTRPDGFRFPARNRIIAGLSLGVVVVEAARKSGSLITAQIALDYGREVFAVPGQMDSFKSEGSHLLIKSGASLVSSVRDIVEEVGFRAHLIQGQSEVEGVPPEALTLLDILETYPQLKDDIIEKSGLDTGRFNEFCLLLELQGLVEMLPGDKIVKRQS